MTPIIQPQHPINFPLFVAWWNRFQSQSTPDIHFDISNWLQSRYDAGDTQLLLMAFRGCGKSTLVGLYAAWRLMINPNLRILVVSADDHLAIRMVRNVRRIIERHPACADILPKNPDEWASDRFTVNRSGDLRDPSMVAAGITGNITGMRADLMICDDVEVPNTSDSADKRDDLRARLHELSFIRASGATMLYIGTPHSFDTIYATDPRDDIPGHVPFLSNFQMLRLPILDSSGSSVWPEKFPNAVIDDIRVRVGSARFNSQMLLIPTNIADLYLDPALIDFYDTPLIYAPELRETFLGSHKITALSAWWDPALATGTGDGSVIAVIATDMRGHYYIHHIEYLNVADKMGGNIAQYQCDRVVQILADYRVPKIGIETNGIGQMLPGILRETIARERLGTVVISKNHHTSKNDRIIHAFETPMAARMIHAHRSILQTRFFDEVRDFYPGKSGNRDDGLDAVASAILMDPIRRFPGSSLSLLTRRPVWHVSG